MPGLKPAELYNVFLEKNMDDEHICQRNENHAIINPLDHQENTWGSILIC